MRRSFWYGFKADKDEYAYITWGRYDTNGLPEKCNDYWIQWFDSREEAERLLFSLKRNLHTSKLAMRRAMIKNYQSIESFGDMK